MKRLWPLVVLVLAACGGPTRSIEGEFTLHSEDGFADRRCEGDGGYGDIREGLNVTLKNEEGTTLSTANFSAGFRLNATTCQFTFTFDEVPNAEFYTVAAGRRGDLTYSFDEMESMDWQLALELGG